MIDRDDDVVDENFFCMGHEIFLGRGMIDDDDDRSLMMMLV